MDNLIYWVWLSQQTPQGNIPIRKLFLDVSDPKRIYFMNERELRSYPYMNDFSVFKLLNKDIDDAKKIIEKCMINNYNIICYDDEFYPERLRNIEIFPILLYHRGHKYKFDELLTISVVGTRKPTAYGMDQATKIARELAYNKALVVSGMAYGIDECAHNGCITIDKPTVAVLGSGIDVIAPKGNARLYDYMLSNGAIYSEYPPGTPGWGHNFPMRNRIISGLSLGTLVVEAERKSGALITANYACEQGRDVFAIPNSIENIKGEGTHKLLKDGAILVTSAIDILNEYKDMFLEEDVVSFNEFKYTDEFMAKEFLKGFSDLSPVERNIAECIMKNGVTVEEILSKTQIPVNYILSSLTMLEIKGVIKIIPGQKYVLNIK